MKELMRLNDNQLKKQLSKMHPYDIANLIKDSSSDIQMRFIKLMSLSKMIDVFIELPNDVSRNYFNLLTENQKKQFLTGFEMDELKIFITSFDEDYQTYLIGLLSHRKQATLKTLMSYDEEAIASIMTTEFLTINNKLSIKEATSFVISNVKDNDFIDDIFVIDSNNQLVGSVSLKDLISARPSDSLESITYKTNNYLTLDDSIYQGFIKFKNYGKSVLPILNNELNIIGIITADDVLNEMILEHEEDIEKMMAVGNYDESSNAGIRAIQRLPWLLISVVLNLVIAVVLSVFERTLVEVIALILFQPMILGMAGNIGTQS
ncbi:MAG TPA: magnesium transporter, partial [Acholeplasma sp.]|nr:magnesium transporter [Acholeplasma sp.]